MVSHKKIILSILSVLLILISIVPSIQLYLNSADGHAYLKRKFNEALPAKFLGTVNFKEVRLAMFSGFLAFDSLSILDNNRKEFAQIPLAVAKFSIFDLLKPHTTIDSLIFIGPHCNFKSDQVGNIWQLKEDSLPPVEPDLVVNAFIVRFGYFTYTDVQKQLVINSRCRDIYSEFDFPGKYFFINLKKTTTDIRYTFLKKRVNTDYVTIKVANNRLFLSDGKVSCEGLNLELGGSVDNLFTDPYFHLNILTDLNSRTFFSRLSSFKRDVGKIRTKIQLNGTLTNPDFHATLHHGGGVLAGVQFDSLLADISYINNFLTIKKAALISQSGKIKISGLLDFRKVFAGRLFTENPDYNALQYTIRADGDDVLRLFTKDSLYSALPLSGFISWRGSGIIPQFMTGLIQSELSTVAKDTSEQGEVHYFKIKSELAVNAGKVKLQKSAITHNGSLLKGFGEFNLFTGNFDFQFKGIAGILPPERVFGRSRYQTVLRVKGSQLNSILSAELINISGNEAGGIRKGLFRGVLKPNGQLTINRAELEAKDGSFKVDGFITAPYFFSDHYTSAALNGELSLSDLSSRWPESQMKGAVYSSVQLKKNKNTLSVDYTLGATGLLADNYRSNLSVEGVMKGDYANLIGDFTADLTRNSLLPASLIKLTGSVHGNDLFVQTVNVPAIESRKVPAKNLQYELNFVDEFLKKLNNATAEKFVFHGKSR